MDVSPWRGMMMPVILFFFLLCAATSGGIPAAVPPPSTELIEPTEHIYENMGGSEIPTELLEESTPGQIELTDVIDPTEVTEVLETDLLETQTGDFVETIQPTETINEVTESVTEVTNTEESETIEPTETIELTESETEVINTEESETIEPTERIEVTESDTEVNTEESQTIEPSERIELSESDVGVTFTDELDETVTIEVTESETEDFEGETSLAESSTEVEVKPSPTSTSTVASSSVVIAPTTTTTQPVASSSVPVPGNDGCYPYGDSQGDSSFGSTWPQISDTIYFANKVPFGSEGYTIAHVLYNGIMTVGENRFAYYPSLEYAFNYRKALAAPFWAYFDWYDQAARVYYHLYESSVNTGDDVEEERKVAILELATNDVRNFANDDFNATTVLVATWENMRPANWYSWICKYYHYYQGYYWYDYLYQEYCVDFEDPELNTFQAIYITDGDIGYVVYLYKNGAMTWQYQRWRRIVIGYTHDSELFEFQGLTYTAASTTLDVDVGNTGVPGYYIYKVGVIENAAKKCETFLTDYKDLITDESYETQRDQLYECPCILGLRQRHWWWFDYHIDYTRGTEIHCYALSTVAKSRLDRLQGVTINKMCCYEFTPPVHTRHWSAWIFAWFLSPYVDTGPYVGRVLGNDPWYWRSTYRSYITQDLLPFEWCCEDNLYSPNCLRFFEIRPSDGCVFNVVIINGWLLGDPHLKTFDGVEYTMNGWGEYVLVEIESEEFMLQGRTDRAVGADGNFTQATVFVAFAARDFTNATFQAELNATQDGMILIANGHDITIAFYGNDSYAANFDDTISISKVVSGDRVTVEAAFGSGLTLKTFPSNQNLEFSIEVPEDFRGETKGLLGNFNNDTTDEFITASGVDLGNNLTERQIYEEFASTWQVTSLTTVFTYPDGLSAVDFQHPEFEPLFLEEANQTVVALATDFCGEGNYSCIYDYVATGDESFASTTLEIGQDNQDEEDNLANNFPTVNLLDGQLNAGGFLVVNNGETHTINVNGSDADGDAITFKLRPHDAEIELTIDGDAGVISYIANTSFPVLIQVYAEDSKGGISQVITVPILACSKCSGNGECDSSITRAEGFLDGDYLLYVCHCEDAWTGDDCESDVDACAGEPCLDLQECVDLTPEEQGNSTVGYTCGDCPDGYEELSEANTCVDTNECNQTDICTNADCLNSVGSFSCECKDGFRETDDNTTCEDIDECVERLHDCGQACDNIDGGYTCSCFEGYTLNNAGGCDQDADLVDACVAKGCSDLCVNNTGTVTCACPTGYDFIASSDTDCENVDECNVGAYPCQQLCEDTTGSYTCSCQDGFQLSRDGVNCEECEAPYWGANCASRCTCTGRGTCDSQRGCICIDGWTGENCNEDVDECTEDPNACHTDQNCTNTVGSYDCECIDGYLINDDGDCEDVDECADTTTHDCDTGLQDCVNNVGSYRCDCISGYSEDADGNCVDIDECTQGIASCDHICTNVEGNYNCECYFGYRLESNRETCEQIEDVCATYNLTCEHECSVDTSSSTAYCICPTGFGLIGETACEDIDECDLDHLNLCDEQDLCVNKNGSYVCSCSAGFRLGNDGRSCIECTGGTWGINCVNSCGCTEHATECSTRVGCLCDTGYKGTYCEEDIDECDTGDTICGATQECENLPGTAHCVCPEGYYEVTANTCEDVDECQTPSDNDCSHECSNTPGSYVCSCFDGYQLLNDGSCTDVDECSLGLDNCVGDCVNEIGRFRCLCPDGFNLGADGASCIVSDACDTNPCDGTCAVVNGVDTCFCPLGQELDTSDNITCNDVDLCDGASCDQNCKESDSNTTIECYCNVGYQLNSDGFTCSECVDGKFGDECSQNCTCIALNTQQCAKDTGTCTCDSGWEGDDCSENIDECDDGLHDCPTNSTCQDTDGSFVCICNDGFFKDGDDCTECPENRFGKECASTCLCDRGDCNPVNGSCDCELGWTGVICNEDVNECTTGGDDCDQANRTNWVCFNSPGSYYCDCADGYSDNGVDCENIDECSGDHLNQCNQDCTDTDGSYVCSCRSGYELQGNFTCVDIDECITLAPCEQVCTNSEASFSCSCDAGFALEDDNTTCFASYEYVISVILDTTLSFILDPANPSYDDLIESLESQISPVFANVVESFVRFIISALRLGSVVIDGTTIVRDLENHRGTMVEALIALASTEITVENKNVTPTIVYNGTELTITADSDKCAIVALLNPCPDGSTCVLKNEVATCQDDDDDDLNIPLIVGLSVGIPLLILVIVLIILLCYLKSKNKKLTRVASREGHYNDNISRPPSGASNGGLLLNEDK